MPNPFLYKNFQTIQFSINTQFICQKAFLFQAIQFSERVLIQTLQLSMRIVFVYPQLNVHSVILRRIPFSGVEFQCQKQFYFK